ncbi:hypothetical protein [Saccharothrix longispora]|uniref:hypothetical protein n=1 Tax=Saccharothrix longispora TaxID=33920 RepID=UPI0028FD7AB7|nr:hypothetical protein [Saccharothrix longispora]MDU0290041.1 hypothetical protein [Saccharothrix longispora]
MYAVDLQILCADSAAPDQAFEVLLENLHRWISREANDAPALSDLRAEGKAVYRKRGFGGEPDSVREAVWQVDGDESVHALRIEIRQPLGVEGASFLSRVTISQAGSEALFRIVMGRDITSGWLSPVPVEELRRPSLVRHVVQDARLRVKVLGQVVDDRYLTFSAPAELGLLVNAVTNASRLPLLVVHPLGDSGYNFVRKAADELLGMARVACLVNQAAWFEFNQDLSMAPVPFGGARLYWPDLKAQHPDFSRKFFEDSGAGEAAHRIMRVLAPVSVVARGRDRGWEAATAAGRTIVAERTSKQLSAARARGDNAEENRVLSSRVEQLEHDVETWVALNEELIEEKSALESQIRELDQQKYLAESWRQQYLELLKSPHAAVEVDLDSAPEYAVDRIPLLLRFLEDWSGGTCRFTENAAGQWRKSAYPHPEKMRSALLALTKAAVRFSEQRGSISMLLDDWFRENFDLKVAMGDKKLVAMGLDRFMFENAEFSRVPHVKLDDRTSPNQVGRIYFAIDHASGSFIVDHIGLKLYGL